VIVKVVIFWFDEILKKDFKKFKNIESRRCTYIQHDMFSAAEESVMRVGLVVVWIFI